MGGSKKFLVCTSTDCSGKGSGALLRDLEDLGASCGFETQASTCLNHCGKGPNVQLSADGKNGKVTEKVSDFKAIEKLIKSEIGVDIKKNVKAVAEIKYDYRRNKGDKPSHLEKAWKLLGGSEEKAVSQEPLQASQLLVMRAREVVGSNPKSALADANKAVEMCNTSGQAWVVKATACEKLNQFEEALQAAEKAIELGEVRDGTGIQRRMKQKVPEKPKEPEKKEGKQDKDKEKKGSKESPADKDKKKAEEEKEKAQKEKADAEAKKKEEEKKKKQEAAKKKKEAEAKKKAEEEAAKKAAEEEAARKKKEEEEAAQKKKEEEEARERAEREAREQERLKKLEEERKREEAEREAKKKREAEEAAKKAEEERQERLKREEALRKQKEEEERRAAARKAYEESFQGRVEALFGCCRSQPIDLNDKDGGEAPTKVVQ